MQGKIKKKGLIRVAVYFSKEDLTPITQAAERLGFRRVGIPHQTQKEHGFADEWEANTDGVGPMLKFAFAYYEREEPKRLKRIAEISQEIAQLEAERKGLSRPAE